MRLPDVAVEARDLWLDQFRVMFGYYSFDARVNAALVKVDFELIQFSLEISRVPINQYSVIRNRLPAF